MWSFFGTSVHCVLKCSRVTMDVRKHLLRADITQSPAESVKVSILMIFLDLFNNFLMFYRIEWERETEKKRPQIFKLYRKNPCIERTKTKLGFHHTRPNQFIANGLVEMLIDLKWNKIIGRKVNWYSSNFDERTLPHRQISAFISFWKLARC